MVLFVLFVPFVAIEIQTANWFSVTRSLTDSGDKTLDPITLPEISNHKSSKIYNHFPLNGHGPLGPGPLGPD